LDSQYGFVGEPANIDVSVIESLTDSFVPVIASIGVLKQTGQIYNINADTLAYKLAQALNAPIYLLSDIPGVLSKEKVQTTLNTERGEAYIEQKLIDGGMIPKVQYALQAIEMGCQKVIIAARS